MKKKISGLLLLLVISSGILRSQTLSPTVISTSGGFYSASNAMLSFTVAEMTMVETYTKTGNILTQGFQQPEDFSSGIAEIIPISDNLLVYPNPTSGLFTLSFTSNVSGENMITLRNLVGQEVFSKNITQNTGVNTVKFDISSLRQGIYLLELTTLNSLGEKQINYHKINLVY